jgi:4-amino-4-deoxy-L-arabinose transferase-like glycosyltransferase
MNLWKFIKKNILSYLPGIIILAVTLLFIPDIFSDQKNKINLLINGIIIVGGISIALLVSLFTNPIMKNYSINLIKKIKQNEI